MFNYEGFQSHPEPDANLIKSCRVSGLDPTRYLLEFEDGRSLVMPADDLPHLLQVLGVADVSRLTNVDVLAVSRPAPGFARAGDGVYFGAVRVSDVAAEQTAGQ